MVLAMRKEDLLRYLAARFDFEPLPHYPMIAVDLCEPEEPLPLWVRSFLRDDLARMFLEQRDERTRIKPEGAFPDFTTNQDKAPDQWRRAQDCVLFLTDVPAAIAEQRRRLRLIEEVEQRNRAGMSLGKIWLNLAGETDWEKSESSFEREWRSIMGQRGVFADDMPLALLESGEIAFLTPDGEIVRR
jgi:hypothetical protein